MNATRQLNNIDSAQLSVAKSKSPTKTRQTPRRKEFLGWSNLKVTISITLHIDNLDDNRRALRSSSPYQDQLHPASQNLQLWPLVLHYAS
jgi:hypothetical protein